MRPKKQFGQNFLTSIPARIAIVEGGEVTKEDTVLEIGPGKGFLTQALLEKGARVVAVEKDRDLIPVLEKTFANQIENGQLILIQDDALDFDFEKWKLDSNKYKLIANIPYYITGAILERYVAAPHQPSMCVVLVQKEVAERICTQDKKESILSLSIKAYGEPKLIYRVSRGSFHPAPKVDSAVLQIKNISRKNFKNQYHEQLFFKAVKAGFAHKRKLLISNLKEQFSVHDLQAIFEEMSLSSSIRAENVSFSNWLKLSEKLSA